MFTTTLRHSLPLVPLLFLAAPLRPALALDPEYVAVPKPAAGAKKEGWDGELSLGASTSLSSASNTVGKPDGVSFGLGLTVTSGLDFRRGSHEWRNSLTLGESFARTPAVDAFVKTQDALAFETIYLYKVRPIPWFGPFARATLDTSIFKGIDVRPSDTIYSIAQTDGSARVVSSQRLRLSDPFKPLMLKQSVGVLARPTNTPAAEVELRLGFGAREIFGNGQLAITDDATTKDLVEAKDLTNYSQAGAEFLALIKGALYGGKVTYRAGAEFMIPFLRTDEKSGKSAFELANIELGAKLSFKLVSWASLDYELKAVRLPQTVDKFQLQNNLLLTFAYALVKREAPPATATKAP